jgi:hypothetical protein
LAPAAKPERRPAVSTIFVTKFGQKRILDWRGTDRLFASAEDKDSIDTLL